MAWSGRCSPSHVQHGGYWHSKQLHLSVPAFALDSHALSSGALNSDTCFSSSQVCTLAHVYESGGVWLDSKLQLLVPVSTLTHGYSVTAVLSR